MPTPRQALGLLLLLLLLLSLVACRQPTAPSPPTVAGPDQLPAIEELPDPFRLDGGGRVASAAGWERRRREIKELLQTYAYGHLPPPGGPVRAEEIERTSLAGGVRRLLRLRLGAEGTITVHLGLIEPSGRGPFPVILHIDHRMTFGVSAVEAIMKRGYLIAGFHPNPLAPDQPGAVGAAQAAHPQRDWGTLAVWAWGAMRMVDYLVTLPQVDAARIIVTGHSRSGKAALLAGALDERFALVAPQGSGCAGAASYRFKGGGERLADIVKNFPHWFGPRLSAFAGKENRLPFDQHFLLALVAPRPLLSIDARDDHWADPYGTQVSHLGARPVYQLLGAASRIGLVLRAGQHELTDQDWGSLLEFADQQLLGKASTRRFTELPFAVRRQTHRWSVPAGVRPDPASLPAP